MNPKHVLLPTDLSEASMRPVEQAPELFHGRQVTLLCVVHSVVAPAPASPFAPPLEAPELGARLDEARQSLEELSARLPAGADVRVEALAGGAAGDAIARWASQNDVDLIALSTHGRTGLRRLALGSVAEAVLRHAHVPVLCFPPREEA